MSRWLSAYELKRGRRMIDWQDHSYFFVEMFWSGSSKRYEIRWQGGNKTLGKLTAARRYYTERQRINCRLLAERVLLGTTA